MQAHISHNLLHFRRGSGFPRVAPHHLDFPKAPHPALCNPRRSLDRRLGTANISP